MKVINSKLSQLVMAEMSHVKFILNLCVQSLERRGIIVARHLVKQLKAGVNSLETTMVQLPGTLQEKYQGLQKYTDDIWMSFKEVCITSQ